MPQDTPRWPFEIDDTIDPTVVTGRAGVPLVIELFRQLGVAQVIDAHVAVKQRQRGLPAGPLVESLIALWTSGGDRCQGLTALREDHALATLLSSRLPAATTVRDFLEAFHVQHGPLWAAGPAATIPLESAPLAGLGQANRTLVAGLQRGAREPTATVDVDATLVESYKDTATVAYDGTRGVPAGGGALGRAGRDPARPVPRWARPRGLREPAGSRTGRRQLAPGPHADRRARRPCPVRDGGPPLVRGGRPPDRVRHQRRHVGTPQGRDRPAPGGSAPSPAAEVRGREAVTVPPCHWAGGVMTSGVSTTPWRWNAPSLTIWNWTGFTTSPLMNLRILPVTPL